MTFSYRDYAAGNVKKTMRLETPEFTRRFLLHVLPRGFVRMRYYGFLANCCRGEKLGLCRRLLSAEEAEPGSANEVQKDGGQSDFSTAPTTCPNCGQGKLVFVEKITASRQANMSMALTLPVANTS